MKGYTVFNVEQIDGLPAHYYAKPAPRSETVQRIERVEGFFAATGAPVVHGGSRACYVPSTDNIHMPCIDFFRDAESYYATLAHETTHWTKHPSRLDRDFGRKRWGDEGYAMEELVAELGSAFLAADLELTPEVRDDHAAYIASWIKVLKDDKRAIFTAASHAQRAADFLHGLQKSAPARRTPRERGVSWQSPTPSSSTATPLAGSGFANCAASSLRHGKPRSPAARPLPSEGRQPVPPGEGYPLPPPFQAPTPPPQPKKPPSAVDRWARLEIALFGGAENRLWSRPGACFRGVFGGHPPGGSCSATSRPWSW